MLEIIHHKRRYTIKATTYDKRGRIIAESYNMYDKTHPYQAELASKVGLPQKQALHAEIAAIIKSRGRDIYKIKVERYDKRGNPKDAAPCTICQLAIKLAGIKYIEHTIG